MQGMPLPDYVWLIVTPSHLGVVLDNNYKLCWEAHQDYVSES